MMILTAPSCCSSFLSINRILTPPTYTDRTGTRRVCRASLVTDPDSFEVGRLIGSYGFMNVTSYSGYQSGTNIGYSPEDLSLLKVQDVDKGRVKIRLYEGKVSQGPSRGTPVIFKCHKLFIDRFRRVLKKVYPGKLTGSMEAEMMATNELITHSFLQSSSKGLCPNLVILVGGFETTTGEQWLVFRNDGKYSAADYARFASESLSKTNSLGNKYWNRFERKETIRRRRNFVIKLLKGAMSGLAYMHNNDMLHQSLGPSSVVLNTISEKDVAYLVPRLRDLAFSVDIRISKSEEGFQTLSEGLWRRATAAGAITLMEKRAFGIADDIYEAGLLLAYLAFVPFCEAGVMDGLSLQRLFESTFLLDLDAVREYCLADERLEEAVRFLDCGDQAGWSLLQAMLHPDFRKRPIAEVVLNHQFLNAAIC